MTASEAGVCELAPTLGPANDGFCDPRHKERRLAARRSRGHTASAEMKWRNGWSAAATFEGEFSDASRSYAGKAVARYAW
jgi:hypothetical protein